MWPFISPRQMKRRCCRGLSGVAVLLLAGCATLDSDRASIQPTPSTESAHAPMPATISTQPDLANDDNKNPHAAERPTGTDAALAEKDLWQRIADNSSQLNCPDLNARSKRWLDEYVRQGPALVEDLQRALPLIEMATGEIERRALPTQFAMLPMVESQYYAPAVTGNRPAGIWQLMPVTARGMGVHISNEYDGRIDYLRATEAAVDLLAHLYREFNGDWRLTNMAFNAGEFRVKSALRKRRGDSSSYDALGLSKITLHHLAKLEALSCLLRDPQRYGVSLPKPTPQDALVTLPLDARIGTGFLAHLAGLDLDGLRRWNPALRGELTPGIAGLRVLLPARNARQAAAALTQIAPDEWWRWGMRIVRSDAERRALMDQYPDRIALVMAINAGADQNETHQLWLPLANRRPTSAARGPSAIASETHVIRRGDTLWDIATRYRVALKKLMTWNRLSARSVLKPGQRIRLVPP